MLEQMNIITTSFNEKVIGTVNALTFSKSPSAIVFDKVYKDIFEKKDTLFVIVGSDSGRLLDYLASQEPQGRKFIFVELDQYFGAVQELINSSDLTHIHLVKASEFGFDYLIKHFHDYVTRLALVLSKSISVIDGVPEYKKLYSSLESQLTTFKYEHLANLDSKAFYDTQLDNICELVHPISSYKDLLGSKLNIKRGILLGGGPSLDLAIPWLKKNQNKIIIFSVGRISKRLKDEGILPDFIITLDPFQESFDNAKELLNFHEDSILLSGEHPNPLLLGQWRGLTLYSRRRFPWLTRAEDNLSYHGPTVTNGLLDMSVFLGTRELYLAGVDFCYTADGISHEAGSMEATSGSVRDVALWVKNYRGESVGTSGDFSSARDGFERQVSELLKQHQNLKVFNLSETAAIIEGVDYVPISQIEVDEEYQKPNIINEMRQDLSTDKGTLLKHYSFLKAEIALQKLRFEEAKKLAKKGEELALKLFDARSGQEKRNKRVLKLKKKLEKELMADQLILFHYAPSSFFNALNPVESESNMTQKEIVDSLSGFFSGLAHSCDSFLKKLKEVLHKISLREKELDESVGLEELSDIWIEQVTPGRLYIWLDQFAPNKAEFYRQYCSEHYSKLDLAYRAMMGDLTEMEKGFLAKKQNPDFYFSRMSQFFDNNKSQLLIKLISELEEFGEHEQVFRALALYGKGLMYELEGDEERALQSYQQIDNPSLEFITEKKKLNLALVMQKPELALNSLERLVQYEFGFMAKYAELLDMMGNVQAAIEVYKMYLQKALDDEEASHHLIQLLIKVDLIDEAKERLQKMAGIESFNQEYVNQLLLKMG